MKRNEKLVSRVVAFSRNRTRHSNNPVNGTRKICFPFLTKFVLSHKLSHPNVEWSSKACGWILIWRWFNYATKRPLKKYIIVLFVVFKLKKKQRVPMLSRIFWIKILLNPSSTSTTSTPAQNTFGEIWREKSRRRRRRASKKDARNASPASLLSNVLTFKADSLTLFSFLI